MPCADTLSRIAGKVFAFAFWFTAIMTALREVGFDLGPILAGAGVLGVAVGFGAQSLVKDVISGSFMLLENQIRVGDVIGHRDPIPTEKHSTGLTRARTDQLRRPEASDSRGAGREPDGRALRQIERDEAQPA